MADPEIERLGANATVQYAELCWSRLCHAARQDGRLFDALWNENDEAVASCQHTKELVWTESAASDHRLYRRFRSHFPVYFWKVDDLSHSSSSEHHPLGGPQWTALLLACEGVVADFNFLTLLRPQMHDLWNSDDASAEEQSRWIVVPRAQFICLELARCKEGYYQRSFRQTLQLYDMKTVEEILRSECLSPSPRGAPRCDVIQDALQRLWTEWPYPSRRTLKETAIVRTLQQCLQVLSSAEDGASICQMMQTQLQTWKDLLHIRRLSCNSLPSEDSRAALRRLLHKSLSSPNGLLSMTPMDSSTAAVPGKSSFWTQTTADPMHITVHASDPDDVTTRFADYGVLIVSQSCDAATIQACHTQAQQALQRLQVEQLKPRQLQVRGANAFDFVEVRQRPGHRIDNRYTILDDPDAPIAVLGRRLLSELPSRLFPEEAVTCWKLLYAGVVHSFPREQPEDPAPPAQFWHRDGPSLFATDHHPTHCFNVFVPLVDVNLTNGTTEFVPGTHEDRRYHQVVADVLLNQAHPEAGIVRADVEAGSIIVFDIRVLHRGLSNGSDQERPVLYFTFARDWFQEQHMFQKTESLRMGSTDAQVGKLCEELFATATGSMPVDATAPFANGHGSMPTTNMEYGHPHYTQRFDLLLWEQWRDGNSAAAMANYTASLRFCRLPPPDKDAVAMAFIHRLTSAEAVARKQSVLENARRARATSDNNGSHVDNAADFATIQSDMSDVVALYGLTAQLLFPSSGFVDELSPLGFTEDDQGICVLLALLKACADSEECKVRSADLEECFSVWWNASPTASRFHLIPSPRVDPDTDRKVLVVFSSLGSGLARPEWYGTLRSVGVYDDEIPNFDVLHVMDFAYSWYCQDPTGSWNGGDYYERELQSRLRPYARVLFLGDSMGGSAALRFSYLAHSVIAFTPQIDIVHYEAVTRADFPKDRRQQLRAEILDAVFRASNAAHITIHYGSQCAEDVRQVQLLRDSSSSREHLDLVEHDYDDHILSLHLRKQGKLIDLVNDAIQKFLRM
jgi:Phytanoyl-CoA dioxygenase (PhyH)